MSWPHFHRGSSHIPRRYMDQVKNQTADALSQVCASFDKGGGVALGDAFAVYSIVASPPIWTNTVLQSGVYAELLSAASVVSSVIPVLITPEDVCMSDIVSLPCPTGSAFDSAPDITLENNLPWFLLNASRFSNHQIIGRKNTPETLLMILQRPWCVLELCCCQSPAILAVHQFATVAAKLNPRLYQPALKLLSHEMRERQLATHNSIQDRGLHSTRPWTPSTEHIVTWLEIRTLYSEMSSSRIRSHNSFWLGLISTCALYLGISCSDLIRNLVGMGSRCTHFEHKQHMPKPRYYFQFGNDSLSSRHPTTTSSLKAVLPRRNSTPSVNYQADGLQPLYLNFISNNRQYLLGLYSHILQIVTDCSE
jgi:hypothetical protein